MTSVEGKVVVAGVGYSEVARTTGRSEGSLALEACLAAIADAGLRPEDVDGISAWPDRVSSAFEGPRISYVHDALGLRDVRYWQAMGMGAGQLSSVIGATYAIVAGAADVVLCYRAHLRQEQPFYVPGAGDLKRVTGDLALRAPYGMPGGAPRFALWAQRHAFERGYTDEDRGEVVLTARAHAQLNPRAVWRGHPLTMEDYLASDIIATPLRLLDCDMPVDGAVAAVLVRADRRPDLANPGVQLHALSHSSGPTLEPESWPDMAEQASKITADRLWASTSLTPADLDVAEIYDGFSSLSLCWMEDLGLVGRGEAGDFLREGHGRIGGRLPLLTDGGHLGGGRLHGFGKFAEAVLQLRGQCGERQVAGAEVALVSAGGAPVASAFILTR